MKQPAAIPLAVALIVVIIQKSKPPQLNNQAVFLSLDLVLFYITVARCIFSMQSFLACIETSFFCQQLKLNYQALKISVTLVPWTFIENITVQIAAFLVKNFKNLSLLGHQAKYFSKILTKQLHIGHNLLNNFPVVNLVEGSKAGKLLLVSCRLVRWQSDPNESFC